MKSDNLATSDKISAGIKQAKNAALNLGYHAKNEYSF